jgi:hypothetical protein
MGYGLWDMGYWIWVSRWMRSRGESWMGVSHETEVAGCW